MKTDDILQWAGAVFIIAGLMVACSPADDRPTDSAGRLELTPAEACVNGVVYYISRGTQHTSYAPKFLPDSTVATCD
jgi:hypothetical protein